MSRFLIIATGKRVARNAVPGKTFRNVHNLGNTSHRRSATKSLLFSGFFVLGGACIAYAVPMGLDLSGNTPTRLMHLLNSKKRVEKEEEAKKERGCKCQEKKTECAKKERGCKCQEKKTECAKKKEKV